MEHLSNFYGFEHFLPSRKVGKKSTEVKTAGELKTTKQKTKLLTEEILKKLKNREKEKRRTNNKDKKNKKQREVLRVQSL